MASILLISREPSEVEVLRVALIIAGHEVEVADGRGPLPVARFDLAVVEHELASLTERLGRLAARVLSFSKDADDPAQSGPRQLLDEVRQQLAQRVRTTGAFTAAGR